ncbi:MAG: biotin transporter BioY [Alphaproteobacteria bacterium]|nr:biotin transporter BioY [Alphaproteobacteria bacterium]
MTMSAELQPMTLAGAVWPDRASPTATRAIRAVVLAVLGSLFVAICAQVQIPLWPVPVTGQTFAVLVVGMAFGWRLGGATLLLYLAEGAVGLPVFAKFAAGPGVLAGPTGGYIVGFVLAAAAIGYLAQRGWDRSVWRTAIAMLIGNVVLYVPGLIWLGMFYAGPGAQYVANTGATNAVGAAIAGGLTPFLLGDALKLALAAALFPIAWRMLSKHR